MCAAHLNNETSQPLHQDHLTKGNLPSQSASSGNGSSGHVDPHPSISTEPKTTGDRQIRAEIVNLSEKVDALRDEFIKAVKDNGPNTNRDGNASLVNGFVLPCGNCTSCLEGSPCPMGLLSALYEDIRAGEEYTVLSDKDRNKQNFYLLKQLDDIFNKILQSSNPNDKPAFQLLNNPILKQFLTELGITVMGLSGVMGMGYPMNLGMPWQGGMMGQPGPYMPMNPGMYSYPSPFMMAPQGTAGGIQREGQAATTGPSRPNPVLNSYSYGYYPQMGNMMMNPSSFYPGMFMMGNGSNSNPLAVLLTNYYMSRPGNFPGLQGQNVGFAGVPSMAAANPAGLPSDSNSPYDS